MQAPPGISLSSTPSSIIQTQKEPADHQFGRPLVVHPVVAAHVYAQNHGSRAVRNGVPIRESLKKKKPSLADAHRSAKQPL